MAYDMALESRLRALLEGRKGVTAKKMFGGLAFMLDGKMLIGIIHDDLMVRINPEDEAAYLKKPHVRPMDFAGRPMKGYLYVAPEGIRTAKSLQAWIDRCVAWVDTIEKK